MTADATTTNATTTNATSTPSSPQPTPVKAPRKAKPAKLQIPVKDGETTVEKGDKLPKLPRQQRAKRGPARPHRRLELEVINTRIEKLEKRLTRAKAQFEDAGRHVEGYRREVEFRKAE
jgi:hypothetical protein